MSLNIDQKEVSKKMAIDKDEAFKKSSNPVEVFKDSCIYCGHELVSLNVLQLKNNMKIHVMSCKANPSNQNQNVIKQ